MKKIMLSLCIVMFLMESFFSPVTVYAAQESCPPHTFSATYSGQCSKPFGYHYYEEGGLIKTCYLTGVYQGDYPRCVMCGFVDYDNPYSESILLIRHSADH